MTAIRLIAFYFLSLCLIQTGTAEIGDDKSREISWFVGYWTDGYYPRLVVVMVDTAADEGAVKFKIAKQLLNP